LDCIGLGHIDLGFLQVLLYILIIAGLVQLIEIVMQKLSAKLYQALGIYLPLITTNCAVLGSATMNANVGRGVLASTLFGLFSGIGFALALLLFASLRERLELADTPPAFQGIPIALVTAGILAMAFVGFSGLC
ncbi:MAG: electron transport complex subunit RsxA, partial [Lentisphaeria bacterium]|nr:electron transport complex subunit RsxA [Lentisphaeria bacterium]